MAKESFRGWPDSKLKEVIQNDGMTDAGTEAWPDAARDELYRRIEKRSTSQKTLRVTKTALQAECDRLTKENESLLTALQASENDLRVLGSWDVQEELTRPRMAFLPYMVPFTLLVPLAVAGLYALAAL